VTPAPYGVDVLSHSVTLVDVPRPFLDTISTTSQALSVFSLTVTRPARAETLVLLLDSSRRGVALLSDTSRHAAGSTPSHVGELLGHHVVGMASAHPAAVACFVLTVEPDATPTIDDAEKWFAFADVCDRAGIVLLDWCVRGFATRPGELRGRGSVWCPKHVAGTA
jgi:hypothetical protein